MEYYYLFSESGNKTPILVVASLKDRMQVNRANEHNKNNLQIKKY